MSLTDIVASKLPGVLNQKGFETSLTFVRPQPAPELIPFVENYWTVAWDRRGQEPYVQEVLSHPAVNTVFMKGGSAIWGVVTGRFAYRMAGQGHVFGIKFRPGAFYPFVRSPVSAFTGTTLSIDGVFGVDSRALEESILSQADPAERVRLVDALLLDHLPERDDNVELITRILDCVRDDRTIAKVDDLLVRMALPRRTTQRLFSEYVGVGLKWIIQRYRLHELAERLDRGETVDWARLALDLGYFDQAHLIKSFKTFVGQTPGEYVRTISLGA